jgi:TP901 family phage tail tape measure protein
MAGKFSIETIFKAIDQFTGPITRMHARSRSFARGIQVGMRQAELATDRAIAGLRSVTRIAGMAGLAVAGLGATVVRIGMNFEEAMSGVAAVKGVPVASLEALRKKAKELGATTKFTATEVALGMEIMAKQGRSTTDILKGIEGILSASAANNLDMATTASIVGKAVNAMGLDISQTTYVADLLTKAAQSTDSTMESLGESLKNAAATGKLLNVPLKEVVAGVASLQNVGLDASEAGSAFARMYSKLTKPSAGMKRQLKEMGVAFQTTKGQMLPFNVVLANLGKAADKSGGNASQLAFFTDLVGERGKKAAVILQDLAKKGDLGKLLEQLSNVEGTSKKSAETRLDNLAGDITLAKSAVDGLATKLYETEGGPLRGIVKGFTKWVDKNQALIAQKVDDYIEKIKEHLPEITTWLKRIAIGVGALYALKAALWITNTAIAAFQLVLGIASLVHKGFALAVLWSRAAVVKFRASTVGATLAQAASTLATKAWAAALWLGQMATTRTTLAQIANTLVTKLQTAATVAYNTVLRLGSALLAAFTLLTSRSTVATVASTIATKGRAAAQWLLNSRVGLGTKLLAGYKAAVVAITAVTRGAAASTGAFALALGAVVAAVAAIYALFDQLSKLDAETGGLGLFGLIAKMWEGGTFDPFKAQDMWQNEQARKRAKDRPKPKLVSVAGHEAGEAFGTRVTESGAEIGKGELTVKLPKDVEAEVTKEMARLGLKLAPTGAFD